MFTDILTFTFPADTSSAIVLTYFMPFAWHTISFFSVMMASFVIIWNNHYYSLFALKYSNCSLIKQRSYFLFGD